MGRVEKEGRESWKFCKFVIFGIKWVLEKGFEALRGAESMKMRCRSVWDHSRGPKPPKMTENPVFFRISRIFIPKLPETKGRPPATGPTLPTVPHRPMRPWGSSCFGSKTGPGSRF